MFGRMSESISSLNDSCVDKNTKERQQRTKGYKGRASTSLGGLSLLCSFYYSFFRFTSSTITNGCVDILFTQRDILKALLKKRVAGYSWNTFSKSDIEFETHCRWNKIT